MGSALGCDGNFSGSTGDYCIKRGFSRWYCDESRPHRSIGFSGIEYDHRFASNNSIITDGSGGFLHDSEIGNGGPSPDNFSLTTQNVNMEVSFCIIDGINGGSKIKIGSTYDLS